MKNTILLAAAVIAVAGPAHAQNEGRLLASNCFQCHGTNGKPTSGGFERLAGQSATEIYNEIKEMQGPPASAETDKEIMVAHANGYTDAQLHLIANFFSQVK
jgi:cytochrome subunit of sulfide dehydrogenase